MRTLAVLVFTTLLGVASHGLAHDANFAAIKIIRQSSDVWSFELKTPLYELDKSMRRFNEEQSRDLSGLSVGTTRYKELIVEYVKASFMLGSGTLGDGGAMSSTPQLGSGRIKLGEHESVLIFNIENMAAAPGELTVRLPFMANNPGQHNILWLVDGQRSQRHILSEGNHFTVLDSDFFDASQQAQAVK